MLIIMKDNLVEFSVIFEKYCKLRTDREDQNKTLSHFLNNLKGMKNY